MLTTLGLVVAAAAPVTSAQAQTIEWSVARGSRLPVGERVQLTIETRWSASDRSTWSNRYTASELPGLSIAQVNGTNAPVRFAIVRAAGRLDCAGTAGRGRGDGTCSFTVDPAFASYLEARGFGRPTAQEAFTLTMSRVGRDLVDATQAIRDVRPTVGQLASMGIHGVTADFVRGFARSGYPLKSADELVSLRIHGADLQWIQGMGAIAPQLRHLSASDLVSMRIHGVTPEWVREMSAIGPEFRSLSGDDLVSMRIHGAKPEMVRAYARLGGSKLSGSDVVSMAIHGVSADFIERLAALGYRNIDASDLVSMRIHGVTPEFVAKLQRSGMSQLSADQLVRLRLAGFDPSNR
jgi:hypothetical protein